MGKSNLNYVKKIKLNNYVFFHTDYPGISLNEHYPIVTHTWNQCKIHQIAGL